MSNNKISYKRAFYVACDLLNGSTIYGIDADRLFEILMDREGVVSTNTYFEFIRDNLDRFSDNDVERDKAIDRLGF